MSEVRIKSIVGVPRDLVGKPGVITRSFNNICFVRLTCECCLGRVVYLFHNDLETIENGE